jgi:hypothetical protein
MDLNVGERFFMRFVYPPPYANIPPGVLPISTLSLEAGDLEISLFEEEAALPGGLAVFFTLENYLVTGVPEDVLAARIRLMRLPDPIFVGGVSVTILGCALIC